MALRPSMGGLSMDIGNNVLKIRGSGMQNVTDVTKSV
jgi:hypothetical protein